MHRPTLTLGHSVGGSAFGPPGTSAHHHLAAQHELLARHHQQLQQIQSERHNIHGFSYEYVIFLNYLSAVVKMNLFNFVHIA